jgi:transposase-like protein
VEYFSQRFEQMAAPYTIPDTFDPAAPMKEAAMFYGLFLRGHSVEALRRDIDVSKATLEKWLRPHRYEPNFQDTLRRIYQFRKQVLAIFDELVLNERNRARLQ